MTNEEVIKQLFQIVRDKGFIQSNRANNTGIGKTFEDYMGVPENNLDAPDLVGYEIKSHREISSSYVTLFTKSPSFPKGANAFLKDNFGEPYEDMPEMRRLHTSMFANRGNSYRDQLSFRLVNDRVGGKITIEVSSRTGSILDNSCGFNYSDIEEILHTKVKKLFYVTAQREYRQNKEWFHFTNAEIYEEPSFDKFLELLDNGDIMYDIRIGTYKSGKNIGKPHDHGSGFRIKQSDICKLYNRKIDL